MPPAVGNGFLIRCAKERMIVKAVPEAACFETMDVGSSAAVGGLFGRDLIPPGTWKAADPFPCPDGPVRK